MYRKIALATLLATSLTGLAQARPHHGPPPPAQVVRRQGDNLMMSQDRGWRKEVVLDNKTIFFEGRQSDPSVREKLGEGDFVMFRDHLESDGLYHVEELHRHAGPPHRGKVLALNPKGLLLDDHGQPLQVDLSTNTGYSGWLSPQVGSHLEVEGKQVGANHVEAVRVTTYFPWPPVAAGLGLSAMAALFLIRRRRNKAS